MLNSTDKLPKIDSLVSIGSACRSRHQIDKFLFKIKSNYQAESYYFDWLMMGGLNGVINVLRRGFEIAPSMISLHNSGSKFIPMDTLSGHTFLHDFGCGWW
jgi:hypothetical protein